MRLHAVDNVLLLSLLPCVSAFIPGVMKGTWGMQRHRAPAVHVPQATATVAARDQKTSFMDKWSRKYGDLSAIGVQTPKVRDANTESEAGVDFKKLTEADIRSVADSDSAMIIGDATQQAAVNGGVAIDLEEAKIDLNTLSWDTAGVADVPDPSSSDFQVVSDESALAVQVPQAIQTPAAAGDTAGLAVVPYPSSSDFRVVSDESAPVLQVPQAIQTPAAAGEKGKEKSISSIKKMIDEDLLPRTQLETRKPYAPPVHQAPAGTGKVKLKGTQRKNYKTKSQRERESANFKIYLQQIFHTYATEQKVRVDNLPQGTTFEETKGFLMKAGEIKFAYMFEVDGKPVEGVAFADEAQAAKAIKMLNNTIYKGAKIEVGVWSELEHAPIQSAL